MIECSICGKSETQKFMKQVQEKLEQTKRCYTCNFWSEIIETKHNRLIIDNNCYTIVPEDGGIRGYSGRRFNIRTFDGELHVTRNLWHQGEVPERFREQLPNNAEFIDNVEYLRLKHGET